MKDLNLTQLEQQILQRSSDSGITRRRRTMVIVIGACATVLLAWSAVVRQSWQLILVVSLLYVVVNIFEKVTYANAVLAYKSLIQKLKKRVEELEPKEGSQQAHEADAS